MKIINSQKGKVLKIAISHLPPLVDITDKQVTGFEIELWEKIAKNANLKYKYTKYKFKNILPALKRETVDVGIAGITITSKREKILDFSYNTLNSDLTILVSGKNKLNVWVLIKSFFVKKQKKFFILLFAPIAMIIVFAHIIWLIERGQGAFSSEYFTGILETCWWLFVSLSTVGYGDFVPATWIGKLLGFVVILIGLGFFGLYVGQISSLFTVKRMQTSITSHKDLDGKKVATLKHTASEEAIKNTKAKVVLVEKIEAAYKKLRTNKVDAIIFDTPVLLYYLNNNKSENFVAIEKLFHPQYYGFAFSEGSKLRETINRELLNLQENGEYNELYEKWFGDFFTL